MEKYKKVIEGITKENSWHPLMQLETGFQGGWATAISCLISDAVKENPQIGISKHLHIGLVKRHNFLLQPNDRVEYPGSHTHIDRGSCGSILSVDVKKALNDNREQDKPSKSEKIEFIMPKVAKNYQEFKDMTKDVGYKINEAIC